MGKLQRRSLLFEYVILAWLLTLGAAAQSGQPNASYLAALALTPARPLVHYQLDLTRPGTHLAQVTLTAPATGPVTTIAMPVWYPGRYSIYHFPANVQQAGAWCSTTGAALPVKRSSPHSWTVHNGACATLRWRYRVFGHLPLNGSFFQLDAAHANLNGGPVFMYVQGEKPNPVQLTITLPGGWHVLNQLGQLDQAELWFPNYDVFIDSPTEAAPALDVSAFQVDGKTYRVLIHDFLSPQRDGAHRAQLLGALEKIVREENALIAPDDLDTYTFFFHFGAGGDDGMEHLFGTQIMIDAALASDAGLQDAEADAAHEFFHQWNIKRIRPVALGPWDYEAENPTPSLWVGEGFTQYYGDITLERTGLESRAEYLAMLGASFGASLHQPGYRLMSAEDSSLTAWFHDATPLEQDTNLDATSVSYYERGEQLAAVIDLDLRAASQGRKSLNDVMRWLWEHTYRAPRTTYYLPGRGYTEADVQRALEAVAGASFSQFFDDYVRGTQPLPYDRFLQPLGLELNCTVPPGAHNYIGIRSEGDRILDVAPGSPADRAGLGRGAVIDAVNGNNTFNLGQLPPGQAARLTVGEHGAQVQLTLTPDPPLPSSCQLQDRPGATPQQIALRAAWLGPSTQP